MKALALAFLWLQLDCSRGEKVEQHPSTLRALEGDSCVLNCTYSDSASNYFPWYRQEAGQGPQLVIDIRSNVARNQKHRFLVSINKAARHVSLSISAAQPGDSGVYFCAASHTASWAPAGCAETCAG